MCVCEREREREPHVSSKFLKSQFNSDIMYIIQGINSDYYTMMKSQCAFNLLRSFFKRAQSPGKARESPGIVLAQPGLRKRTGIAGVAEKDRKSSGTSGQVPAGRAAGTGMPLPGLCRDFPGLCPDFARAFLALAGCKFVTVCEK